MPSSAAAASVRPGSSCGVRHFCTFQGQADHVRSVRRVMSAWLAGCPAADDAVLIASELATNAILHSLSRGKSFTVRCHASPGYLLIEVEDLGGPWRARKHDRPHGLDIIEALAGTGNWGRGPADGQGTIVWARLGLPAEERGRAGRM